MADAAGVGLERFEGDSAIAVEKYTFEKTHRLAGKCTWAGAGRYLTASFYGRGSPPRRYFLHRRRVHQMIRPSDDHFGYMMMMLKLRVTLYPTPSSALTRDIDDNEGLLTLDHPKLAEGIIFGSF